MPLILEGIITTLNADSSANIAPLGPIVDRECTHFTLRPFKGSKTYANLRRHPEAVFHVTDDVELLARGAIGAIDSPPALVRAQSLEGWQLADCCRWYALRVESVDDRQERTEMSARVVDQGRVRDFFGFNRAKHAVVEAAILATRLHLVAPGEVTAEYDKLAVIVGKTGGDVEHRAFDLLRAYVAKHLASS